MTSERRSDDVIQAVWDVLSVPGGTPEHLLRRQRVQAYLAEHAREAPTWTRFWSDFLRKS